MTEIRFRKNKDILYKRGRAEKIIFIVVFIMFSLYAVSLIFPFVWLFMSSLKDGIEYAYDVAMMRAFALPKRLMFSNYADAFTQLEYDGNNLLSMFFNSIWYVAVVVGEGVFFSAVTGYCLAKYNFKIKALLYGIAIFSMTIPIVGTLGASFKLSADLGIYDTPLQPIITCAGGFGFNFLIMYAYFSNISWSYAEAVFVDGGGNFTAFFKVMLPQAKAPILTLAIISSISAWNDYTSIILFLPSYPTLTAGLYYIERALTRGFMPTYYAALFIVLIPILVIFIFFSDTIMENFTMGGLKG